MRFFMPLPSLLTWEASCRHASAGSMQANHHHPRIETDHSVILVGSPLAGDFSCSRTHSAPVGAGRKASAAYPLPPTMARPATSPGQPPEKSIFVSAAKPRVGYFCPGKFGVRPRFRFGRGQALSRSQPQPAIAGWQSSCIWGDPRRSACTSAAGACRAAWIAQTTSD